MNELPTAPHLVDQMEPIERLRYWRMRSKIMLGRFGLPHWKFRFSNTRRRIGVCNPRDKAIELSKYYVVANDFKDIDDTLRHEIAHALVSEKYGKDYAYRHSPIKPHGREWRSFCQVTGAQPRAKKGNLKGLWKYHLECPNCGATGGRNRMSRHRMYYCGYCDTNRPMKVTMN